MDIMNISPDKIKRNISSVWEDVNDFWPGTQGRPDRILKNFIHSKKCEHAPLIMELSLWVFKNYVSSVKFNIVFTMWTITQQYISKKVNIGSICQDGRFRAQIKGIMIIRILELKDQNNRNWKYDYVWK